MGVAAERRSKGGHAMSIADEIERLENLRRTGALSEAEFQEAKRKLLEAGPTLGQQIGGAVERVSSDVNLWSMLIHLTQFCGYLVPLAGLVVPIVLWQVKKGSSALIDRNGRIVTNWIISEVIYFVVAIPLCFIFVGFPLAAVVAILGIVFPIIGGIKASSGEAWPYPLSIRFFPLDEPR
jgi:uncharacterized protein